MFNGQSVLPAVKSLKEFERVLQAPHKYFIVLEMHLSNIAGMKKQARQANKNMILHADLIQGLKSDRAAAEFLCQVIQPAGLISTRADVLRTAKKNGVLAIQRVFLLDTLAIETSDQLAKAVQPDVIELLPGVIPIYIERVKGKIGKPVIAGGLIETDEDVEAALKAGAQAVTTSKRALW